MDHLTLVQSDPVAEANHRVANSLALLASLTRMQARAIGKTARAYSNAEVRLLLDGTAARIATIGQLHRMLAHMPGEGAIPLGPHLREVCAALVTAFSSEQQQVHIAHHGPDCLVPTKYIQPLTLIICEILINAMKYAHPTGVAVHVRIACETRKDGSLSLSIGDDGIGLPEGFDSKKDGGFGFQIIRALAAEIGAELDIQSDPLGTSFNLMVPSVLTATVLAAPALTA